MFLVVSLKKPSTMITLFEILNDNIQSIRLFESMNDVKNCHRNYYIWIHSIKYTGWAEMSRVVDTDRLMVVLLFKKLFQSQWIK